ncbi:MAG: hypothetical protein KUG73_14365, partial [Pseudomonadales bacterium]|nr:hypothetical protein [Pseudomonadales bacterium]
FLFQNPCAVGQMCRLAKSQTTQISVIGYSRRQADFLVSAYSQWLFRSQERVNETTQVLETLGLEPILFTGLERQLIASIANDFYSARQLSEYSILDWHRAYHNIVEQTQASGAHITCGILPKKASDTPLIQDFCEKAGLTLRPSMDAAIRETSNASFNQDIIEAMNNAVSLGFDMPGPHESNDIIELLSSKMNAPKKNTTSFLSHLKCYIDTFYVDSNNQLCKAFNLNDTYFSPAEKLTKPEILDIIINEGQQRSVNKSEIIQQYQMLSARMIELCFTLTQKN